MPKIPIPKLQRCTLDELEVGDPVLVWRWVTRCYGSNRSRSRVQEAATFFGHLNGRVVIYLKYPENPQRKLLPREDVIPMRWKERP